VGLPLVDLGTLVQDLYRHADVCRENALAATRLAEQQRREASYLEDLAAVLAGEG
jgi:hypothetical protein